MTSSEDSVLGAIAAAVKELSQLAKQLTNIAGVLQKNIGSYWKIKDAAHQRTVAIKIEELSRAFSDIGFLQVAMVYAYERPGEFDTEIAARLEKYANKVEQTLELIQVEFSELIQSDDLLNSLPVLLEKRRVAAELRSFLNKRISSSAREPELIELLKSFIHLGDESIKIARLMRDHADSMRSRR
jgi:hypothetical protein